VFRSITSRSSSTAAIANNTHSRKQFLFNNNYNNNNNNKTIPYIKVFVGLVVRVPGSRSRGPGSIPVSGSFVGTTEVLLGRTSGSGLESREYGCGNPSR
jgi:hypothetical protein